MRRIVLLLLALLTVAFGAGPAQDRACVKRRNPVGPEGDRICRRWRRVRCVDTYLRTGELMPVVNAAPETGHVIGMAINVTLGAQEYRLRTSVRKGGKLLTISGGSDVAVLYGAYAFVEKLGVRFYLHGDMIPDDAVRFEIPDLDETHKPLFEKRGIQPFHDFPEGPDWWTIDEWKTAIAQLVKMRMNFIGLHCYPKGALGPEPAVWIGLPEDCQEDGTVKVSDSTSWHNTQRDAAYGCYRPMKTGDFASVASRAS